jgi:1-deoxy-D-xylulose-5-phosphate reductoisomerase
VKAAAALQSAGNGPSLWQIDVCEAILQGAPLAVSQGQGKRMQRKRIILLGSTGSIGESTLDVVENLPGELQVVALAAHSRWERLCEQVKSYRPEAVALIDERGAVRLRAALEEEDIPPPRILSGAEGLVELVRSTAADVVVGAVSGAAGLPAVLAGLETGKDLALANKEALVMAGAILTRLAREHGRQILPIDSEHSAIFQSLLAGRRDEVRTIILTASGGPFRNSSAEELARATRREALRHPTWRMGEKITIDSATLMNKALEVIEAHWLFDLPPAQIEVVIHPQSIVHSLVEFQDGSTICQLGPPDMKIPIQYALTYPRRRPLPLERLRLADVEHLTFQEPDPERFPALRLAYEVLEVGGVAPAVLNAANEVAVASFLREEISFPQIFATIEGTLRAHVPVAEPALDQIFTADAWARADAERRILGFKATRSFPGAAASQGRP